MNDKTKSPFDLTPDPNTLKYGGLLTHLKKGKSKDKTPSKEEFPKLGDLQIESKDQKSDK